MAESLAKSRIYKQFVSSRNKQLEQIHLRTQLKTSAILHETLTAVKDLLKYRYNELIAYGIYSYQGKNVLSQLEKDLNFKFTPLSNLLAQNIKKMRMAVYLLTYSSEAEAIGQAIGKKTKYTLDKPKLFNQINTDSYSGGSIENRVAHSINRLIRKIINAYELSAIRGDTIDEMNDSVSYVLPKLQKVSGYQRNLKVGPVLKEADKPDVPDMSIGYVDDDTWDVALSDYLSDNVPTWRSGKDAFDYKTKTGETETVYAWEVEKEITQDFVYQVRQGQVDAAKENGITDYVWVAVVDKVTDECCLWRDGLTTQEIEYELKTSRKDDDCQTIVPPAHFNCRCVLAPMVEEMPERPESNEKDFERWLNET